MSDTFQLAEAYCDLTIRDSQANATLARFRQTLQGTSQAMEKFASSVSMLGAAGVGVAAAVGMIKVLKGMVDAAAAAETSHVKLAAALKVNDQEVTNNTDKMQKLAVALQDHLNITQNDSRAMMAHGVQLGLTTDQTMEYTKAAVGLATALNIDVQSAFERLVRAGQGSWGMMERQVKKLRELHTQEERLAYVQDLAARGMAARKEEMGTLEQKQAAFAIALDNLNKAWGELAMGPMKAAVDVATRFLKVVTLGSDESRLSLKALEISWLSLRKVMDELPGGQGGDGATKALNKALSEGMKLELEIQKKKKDADAELTNAKLANLEQLNKAHGHSRSLESIWEDAQENALAQLKANGPVGGLQIPPGGKIGDAGWRGNGGGGFQIPQAPPDFRWWDKAPPLAGSGLNGDDPATIADKAANKERLRQRRNRDFPGGMIETFGWNLGGAKGGANSWSPNNPNGTSPFHRQWEGSDTKAAQRAKDDQAVMEKAWAQDPRQRALEKLQDQLEEDSSKDHTTDDTARDFGVSKEDLQEAKKHTDLLSQIVKLLPNIGGLT